VCLLGTRRGYLGPGIRFEDVAFHIGRGDLVDILEHANRYAGQHVFIVQREDYLSLVPFVEDEHTVFLKTIIPSRKTTKQYLADDEKALLESVERGEWKSAGGGKRERTRYCRYVRRLEANPGWAVA
jgi:hypothetical protein